MVQPSPWFHHRGTEDTEKFKSFICREIPANEIYVSVCGDGVFTESIRKEEFHYRANRPCDEADHLPPKAAKLGFVTLMVKNDTEEQGNQSRPE
jgi:hypothetical protein